MKSLVRPLLAFSLLGALLLYVDPRAFVQVLTGLDLLQVVLLFGLSFLMIYVSCVKWQMFLHASGVEPRIGELFRLYVIGYFINLFGPSTLGGDAVRSYAIGKRHGSQAGAFSATFFERFTGIMAMAFLAVLFLLLGSGAVQDFALPVLLFFCLVAPLAVASFTESGFALFEKVTHLFLGPFKRVKLGQKALRATEKVRDALSYARGDRPLFVKSLFISMIFHALTILNTKLAANAVGWWGASVLDLFVVIPLILIVGAIPITPSGIGIQEGAFIFLLQRVGAEPAQAAGVALLLRAKTLALGAIGGVLFALKRKEA